MAGERIRLEVKEREEIGTRAKDMARDMHVVAEIRAGRE